MGLGRRLVLVTAVTALVDAPVVATATAAAAASASDFATRRAAHFDRIEGNGEGHSGVGEAAAGDAQRGIKCAGAGTHVRHSLVVADGPAGGAADHVQGGGRARGHGGEDDGWVGE